MWSLNKAFNDIRRRKIRSMLTVLGIFIGVAGIVAIVATARNLTEAQRYNFANVNQSDLRWFVRNNTASLEPALAQLPNVAAYQRRGVYSTKFRADAIWRDVSFYSFDDFNNIQVNKIEIVAGRFPRAGEVVLEASNRDLLPNIKLGDEVIYRYGPQNTEAKLTVVGFAQSPAYPSAAILQYSIAYVSPTDIHKMRGLPGLNEVLLRLNNFDRRDETKRTAEALFERRNLDYGGLQTRDPDNYLGKAELDTLLSLLLIFSLVGLVISGFLVANTLSAIVTEQLGEIGTLKAIGASRGEVLRLYLLTALLYGLMGTALGIAGGFLGGRLLLGVLGGALNFDVSGFFFQPDALVLGLVVGLGVTLLAAFIPAWGGTGISVRQALDSYGISSTYGGNWLEKLLASLRRVPPLAAMAVRNLGRRKVRNLVTFGVISLSCAAFLAATSTSTSVDYTLEQFYKVNRADAFVSFGQRPSNGLASNLAALSGVELAEPWTRSRANYKATATDLWGVPVNTRLYQWKLAEGRWLTNDENGVALVTTVLAAAKNVRLGDTIELEVGQRTVRLQVIGILDDNTRYLNSTATGKVFTSVEEAERILGRQSQPDFFAVSLQQHDQTFVDNTLRQLEERYRQLRPSSLPAYSDRTAVEQVSQLLRLLLYAMVIIIAFIGAIGIINTLTLNVLERRREIGILRSIGGTDLNLVQLFLTEGLLLGVLGFVVGLIAGYPLAQLLVGFIGQATFPLIFVFDWRTVILTLGFGMLLTAGASLGPALGAARIKIGNTLRYG